ncbi:hypothetical protein ACRAWC_22790 [Leifsonia sp. L25]|uniref:hypothetical protein n=1 Tax=Leifsonia sp. L25 TaxID=3423957 RepID=UPI003D68365E
MSPCSNSTASTPGRTSTWDGELLGSVRGLYHRARLLLTAAQRAAGRHKLALRVHPAPVSEPQVGRTERVRLHTPRLGYGWDFTPRLRHQGVWKGVRIRLRPGAARGRGGACAGGAGVAGVEW